jgi:hypothetical protein
VANVSFDGLVVPIQFLVMPGLSGSAILGMDVLRNLSAQLSLDDNRLAVSYLNESACVQLFHSQELAIDQLEEYSDDDDASLIATVQAAELSSAGLPVSRPVVALATPVRPWSLQDIHDYLASQVLPAGVVLDRSARQLLRHFHFSDNLLFRRYRGSLRQVLFSDEELHDHLKLLHDEMGHLSFPTIFQWIFLTDFGVLTFGGRCGVMCDHAISAKSFPSLVLVIHSMENP